jgi:hypothetical protein
MNFNYINNKQDTKQFGFVIEHDFWGKNETSSV